MSKFKMKFKIQGLELEVEGAREDMSLIGQNLSRQMAGMFEPASAIIEGHIIDHTPSVVVPQLEDIARKKIRKRRQTANNSNSPESASAAIDWKHDPAKYGMPKQDWTTEKKAMWTLYVVSQETSLKELSSRQIVDTFNKHFRQAKIIQLFNVNRDLGKAKVKKTPSLVGELTTKTPSAWFLTEEGTKQVQKLISETLMSNAA